MRSRQAFCVSRGVTAAVTVFLFAVLLVQTTARPAALHAQAQLMPADFAVRFVIDGCRNEALDTFLHLYAYSSDPAIPVVLSDEVTRAIHALVTEARFFEYPSDYKEVGRTTGGPDAQYRMMVRSAGVTHTVSWRAAIGPATSDADRLQVMFNALRSIMANTPEVARFPKRFIACG